MSKINPNRTVTVNHTNTSWYMQQTAQQETVN